MNALVNDLMNAPELKTEATTKTAKTEAKANYLLQKMINRGELWQAGRGELSSGLSWSSGYAALDEKLPAGGWPSGKLTEFLCDQQGCGEWNLLLPVLAQQSQQNWVILVNPPYMPYAPALKQAGMNLDTLLIVNAPAQADQLWVMEQALRSSSCGAVVCWPESVSAKQLRRLQLACAQHRGLAFIYRSSRFANQNSPAHLRMHLRAKHQSVKTINSILRGEQLLEIEIIKRPNGWACSPFTLAMQHFDYIDHHLHHKGSEGSKSSEGSEKGIHSIDLLNLKQDHPASKAGSDGRIPL